VDTARLICDRARAIDASGIRRIFNLAAKLTDPINLSIGQPDFPVPEAVRAAARDAIEAGRNGYTSTQGTPELVEATQRWLKRDLGWESGVASTGTGALSAVLTTAGTSGALTLAFLAMLGPGDECVIPDPYFVAYPHLATMAGGRAVRCETYPDFRMTAERVEPLLSERTKFVLLNTPSNPAGVVMSPAECRDLLDLCRSRGVLLISDEIYDEFCFPEAATDSAFGDATLPRCPSPARLAGAEEDVLLIRGFGKTYGCTGWRLGYAAGPTPIIDQMAKLQQYTYVCAPAPLQAGAVACFGADMSAQIADYQARRDLVLSTLAPLTDVPVPGGAFYAFFAVPERLGMTAQAFVEKGIERSLLTIPGNCFSARDTHVRLSYATSRDNLERGLAILAELLAG
jgi:aspartate/methionine/tyrosine aminotransferase